jgi:murein DD-endopeptidase MepM/ murein hydrolase activator NlpD
MVSCTATIPILIFVASVIIGWYVQAFSLRGPMTQMLNGGENLAIAAGRWTRFAYMAGTKEAPTMSQMRRQLAKSRAETLGLGTRVAAGRLLAGLVDQPWIDAASRNNAPQETLLWPVPDGWFSRGYGSGQGGYHRAFDIMGSTGLDVLASASGIVGYVGNTVSGYGNLIIIIHPRGWVTAYGHNQHMYVIPGEYVTRGQVIASVGSTGRSTGPHLHFEFIAHGKNCDPAALFRPAVMHPEGKYSDIKQTLWPLAATSRPKEIRCGVRIRHPITNEAEDGIGLVEPAYDPSVPDTAPADSVAADTAAANSPVPDTTAANAIAVEAKPEP